MTDMAASADQLAEGLSNDKSQLLELLLQQRLRAIRTIERAPRDTDEGEVVVAASWAQQRLWFIDQLERAGSAYHIPFAVRLRGDLQPLILQRALDTLVQRHEVLRTTFLSIAGEPRQRIRASQLFKLPVLDLTGMDPADQERALALQKDEEFHAHFDLQSGPLLRGRLLRLAPAEHVLLITMHHAICDGWSMGVIARELSELYAAYAQGRSNPLRDLHIQYGDYSQWQQRLQQQGALALQLDYWRAQLADAPLQLEVPTDRPRPAIQSYRGDHVSIALDASLSSRLKVFGNRNDMTLFMVLLAAWSILLARISSQEDILIGTPIANRQTPELEELIGFFVNTLVLRVKIRRDMSVGDLLADVRRVTLEAYDHQDAPFERVVEAIQPERSLSRNPLFQAMFVLQNAPQHPLSLPQLSVADEEMVNRQCLFDLLLSLHERDDQIHGVISYATDLFDRQTLVHWAECFIALLESIVEGIQPTVGDLAILTESARQQIVNSFNPSPVAYPSGKLIHELFEEQVVRTPDVPAVEDHVGRLTYAELNARANRLGRHLRGFGVGPDDVIGVCLERNANILVALVGILKAGAAYLPLDPAYPPERLRYMMKDAAPKVVLTSEALRHRLPPVGGPIVILEDVERELAALPADNLDSGLVGLRSDHLAYIIYTSGSTGQPKGVAIEHRNTVNLIHWAASALPPDTFRRVLQSTSLNFDLSVYECFVPLALGGCVYVVENALALATDSTDVVLVNTVPSAMRAILDANGLPTSVRTVNLAGEVLKRDLVEKLFSRCPVDRVCNLYGPSETTTYSTWSMMSRKDGFNPTVGRPIANTEVYILDEGRQVVPIGVRGEIYIGGTGVARGYLNQPELTRQRFVSNSVNPGRPGRMYRTGDLGRWRSDGTVEYLGRNDQQIKIRGHRIELGEVERQLATHGDVHDAVVVHRDDTAGDIELIAYVVPSRSGDCRTAGTVTATLRDTAVDDWEGVWKETYESQNPSPGPSFVGWKSSYTGEPIPENQMQDWLCGTIERIKTLQPRKVLEIGCGVGLLLKHLAPGCAVYVGTDFSQAAIEQLGHWVSGRADLEHVQLFRRSAIRLEGLPPGSFDTIVLNSVIQYFPDVDYLLQVLLNALPLLQPGGKIFIGDIRHLGLLSMFHSTVQLSRASANVSAEQLRSRIVRAIKQEKELLIDPEFFRILPAVLPGIAATQLQLKRGREANELTRYRYDVVLYTDGAHTVAHESIDWPHQSGDFSDIEAALRERRWRSICLSSVPNSRLAAEAAAQRLLEECDGRSEASALRRQLAGMSFRAMDPERLWDLGRQHDYDVTLSWNARNPTCCDVQFVARPHEAGSGPQPSRPVVTARPLSSYANDPLSASFRQSLVTRLREHLNGSLPEYMVPRGWMILDELPLTPSGKVDRRALPAPYSHDADLAEYIAPETEDDLALAGIWEELLRVDRVGMLDNFFALGGHSLLGMKLIARIAQQFSVRISITALFEYPTLQQLTGVITALRSANAPPPAAGDTEFDEGAV